MGRLTSEGSGNDIVYKVVNLIRGFFLDDSGNGLERADIADNEELTLLRLGYVFLESNATTIDVSYRTPKHTQHLSLIHISEPTRPY